jgi:putative ABC transport system permease protein
VVFQFTTSIILIIGTITVYKQLNYIQNKKLGFNKEQVLIINGTYSLGNNIQAFKDDVLAMSGVKGGTLSSFLPVSSSARNDNTYSKEAVMDSKNGIDMQTWTVDYDYVKTMGMEIIKGRNFSKDFADSNAIIINETTAKFLGYEDPVGEKMYTLTDASGQKTALNIIGVVKNFNFESLRQNVGPLCMRLGTQGAFGSFKVEAGKAQDLIGQIESKWKVMAAGLPFSYRFLDDSFDEMYRNEQRIGKLAISFAVLAIFIACLGLFGLATYMAEQRTKEIGIRKVLGASVGNVVNMLSKDFIILVIVSSVIAFPIAWWAMHNWLQDFAYRINIGWWIFIAAGVIAFLIAFITVSSQAIRAALANPVKSLRTE